MAAESAVSLLYPGRMVRRECGVKDSIRQTHVNTFCDLITLNSDVIGHFGYVQSCSYK